MVYCRIKCRVSWINFCLPLILPQVPTLLFQNPAVIRIRFPPLIPDPSNVIILIRIRIRAFRIQRPTLIVILLNQDSNTASFNRWQCLFLYSWQPALASLLAKCLQLATRRHPCQQSVYSWQPAGILVSKVLTAGNPPASLLATCLQLATRRHPCQRSFRKPPPPPPRTLLGVLTIKDAFLRPFALFMHFFSFFLSPFYFSINRLYFIGVAASIDAYEFQPLVIPIP